MSIETNGVPSLQVMERIRVVTVSTMSVAFRS